MLSTLVKKLWMLGKDFLVLKIKGNTALMISNASSAPTKVIKVFEKTKLEKPTLKGEYIESIYLGHNQLDILAALKSKEELLIV